MLGCYCNYSILRLAQCCNPDNCFLPLTIDFIRDDSSIWRSGSKELQLCQLSLCNSTWLGAICCSLEVLTTDRLAVQRPPENTASGLEQKKTTYPPKVTGEGYRPEAEL